MASIKELIKKNIIGTQYEWESHFENILSLCDKHLTGFQADKLLDVGCGNGERTTRVAKYFHVDLTNTFGVDANEEHITECRKRMNAEVVDLEASDLPYESESFDLVICNQVLEHLKNYQQVISEIIRVAKKDGYILLGVPNLAHFINRFYLLFGRQPMCIAIGSSHVRGFTHRGFLQVLESMSDIELIDYTGALMYPFPYRMAKHLSKRFVGAAGFTCYLCKKTG